MNARRDALVETHLELVRLIAIRVARRLPRSFELDDLIQQGCLGLMQAAARYQPALNSSFEAYARPRIMGAMRDSVRRKNWTAAMFVPLDQATRPAHRNYAIPRAA